MSVFNTYRLFTRAAVANRGLFERSKAPEIARPFDDHVGFVAEKGLEPSKRAISLQLCTTS